MTDLAQRARRAYEWGRLRFALRLAPIVAGAAVVAFACGRPFDLCGLLGGALLLVAVGLTFLGGSAAGGVVPGLVAGLAPLALLVRTVGHACVGNSCMALCMPACIAGGALAGAFIATRRGDAWFLLVALLVAGLTGSLGCTMAGMSGVLGMLGGALLAGAPVLALRRAA